MHFRRINLLAALTLSPLLAFATATASTLFHVDPEAGHNNLSAVFDAPLGERISAISSSVGCNVQYAADKSTASGTCTVPLTSIMVDNQSTKTEHFQQWATNKKTDPKSCRLEARFADVKIERPTSGKPTSFKTEVPFTVCGRGAVDGKKETVEGTATLLQPGRIDLRAKLSGFSRDRYQIGPKYTDGWLARVQNLANVVADQGTVELAFFAEEKK